MGKAVFLVLYLWHGGSRGGPALTVASMPSLAVCEAVGAAAKALVDRQPKDHERRDWLTTAASEGLGVPAVYRCIEVPR